MNGRQLRGPPIWWRPMIERLRVTDREIADAVAAAEDEMLDLLVRLVEAPTTLGNEESGQEIVELAYRDLLGLEPMDIALDADALRAHPLASPFSWDVSGSGTWSRTGPPPAPAAVPSS